VRVNRLSHFSNIIQNEPILYCLYRTEMLEETKQSGGKITRDYKDSNLVVQKQRMLYEKQIRISFPYLTVHIPPGFTP
jgi:hypothetical protein